MEFPGLSEMIALAMLAGTLFVFWTAYTRSQRGEMAQYRIDLRADLEKYERQLEQCRDERAMAQLSSANMMAESHVCKAQLKAALAEIERLKNGGPGQTREEEI